MHSYLRILILALYLQNKVIFLSKLKHIIPFRFNEKSKVKATDTLLKEYPAFVSIKGSHNHAVSSAAALRYKDMSVETAEKLIALFRRGHSPSSALHSLKTDLLLDDAENYHFKAADGSIVPSLSKIDKLFKQEFMADYGKFHGPEMFSQLQMMLKNYSEQSGGIGKFQFTSTGQHYFVILFTPTMLRVHQRCSQARELVMLDSSGGMDKQRHRVYFFVTPTAAGGLPLGTIISDCEQEAVFTEAISCFKELLPQFAFYNSEQPQIFLTDNDLKERNALRNVFPNSILLLCQFHILKGVWTWLCETNHGVKKEHRQEIYFLFHSLLYSSSESAAEKQLSRLISFAERNQYRSLIAYINFLWISKKDWANCFRQNLITRGNNTTNYVEVVFRILKDCILNRVMAFNLTQLVDFILTKYEAYIKKRLHSFCNGTYTSSLLRKMLPEKVDFKKYAVIDEAYYFTVTNLEKMCKYTVDITKGICSCLTGSSGRLCIHSSAVIMSLENNTVTSFNIINEKVKEDIFFVATGTNPPNGFFLPLIVPAQCLQKLEVGLASVVELEANEGNTENQDAHKQNCTVHEQDGSSENSATEQNSDISVLSNEEQQQLHSLFRRIQDGLNSDPKAFVPAVRKMLKNASTFAATQTGLLSALHTFGKYTGYVPIKQIAANKIVRRSHKFRIGVQPTALGRRKTCLTGRNKLTAGRPGGNTVVPKALHCHDYTAFGHLPLKKRKAPHNLQECVFRNKLLGSTKRAKN